MQRPRGRGAGIPQRPAGLVSGERRGCHGECSQNFGFHSEFHGRVLRGIGDDFKYRPCSCGVGGGRGVGMDEALDAFQGSCPCPPPREGKNLGVVPARLSEGRVAAGSCREKHPGSGPVVREWPVEDGGTGRG